MTTLIFHMCARRQKRSSYDQMQWHQSQHQAKFIPLLYVKYGHTGHQSAYGHMRSNRQPPSMLVNLLSRIVYASHRCVGQGLIGLPELRELDAIEIDHPPPAYSVSVSELRGGQETPYANTTQTNAIELYLASCPALGREEAESDLPGDATKPNADLHRMVVLNLSLKTYFRSFFSTTARPVAASNAERGSKLQKHGADYIPAPTLRSLTQVYATNDLVCSLNRSTDVFTLRPSGYPGPFGTKHSAKGPSTAEFEI